MSIEPEPHHPMYSDPQEQYNYVAGQINALNTLYKSLGSETQFVLTSVVENFKNLSQLNNNPFVESLKKLSDKGKDREPLGSGPPIPPDNDPASTTPYPRDPFKKDQKFKVKVPDNYTGDVKKVKTFVCQLMLYFKSRDTKFSTQRSRVIFALSYMRGGTAGPWADHIFDKIMSPLIY